MSSASSSPDSQEQAKAKAIQEYGASQITILKG